LSLKDKLFANLGWKIVAILLALVLWFHVATEKIYEKRFPARVEVSGLARDLEVEAIDPAAADVSVIGTGKELLQLMLSGGLKARIDVSPVSRPGVYDYEFGLANLYNVDVSSFKNMTILSGNHLKLVVKSRT
jgi:YbbR domain-containing protein